MSAFERLWRKEPEFQESMAAAIKTENIAEAAPALFELARQVAESDKIYDLILSDDASGRLISLFLKKILDGVYGAKGLEKPDIRFVAGGRHDNQETFEAIGEIIQKLAPSRTLLVTEIVSSGASIRKLMLVLERLKLNFDVATLSSANRLGGLEKTRTVLHEGSDTRFFMGEEGYAGNNFYNKTMTGVKKSSESPIPKKTVSPHYTEEHKEEIQKEINQARQDIDLLAQETLKALMD